MKRTLVIAGILAALLICGTAVLLLLPKASVTLRFVQQLGNPKVVEAVRAELKAFESLHPAVRVELAGDGAADLAALANYPSEPASWVFPLTPWSGSLWVLAARHDRLEKLAQAAPEAVAALRAGTLEPAAFVALLAQAKTTGVPLTLGNSHQWPWMVWVQVWTAATQGPGAAQFPSAPTDAIKAAAADLKKWRAAGWFDEKAWMQGWAQGLGPLQSGTAFFALVNESMVTAIAPQVRGQLEFLRFPRKKSDTPWNVGSAHFLAVSSTSSHADAAAELVHFLTSPGVTARLAQATGRPFFSWKADGTAPMVLPDWTSRANDQAFRDLATQLLK